MSNLLIDETVIPVSPSLASKIGLQESIFLQQLHWLTRQNHRCIHFFGGETWVRHTYKEWLEYFEWSNNSKIKRVISGLKGSGLIFSEALDKPVLNINNSPVRWYRVNYETLSQLTRQIQRRQHTAQIALAQRNTLELLAAHGMGQNDPTKPLGITGMGQNDPRASGQNGLLFSIKNIKELSSSSNTSPAKPDGFDFDEARNWIVLSLSESYDLNTSDARYIEGKLREFIRRYGDRSEGDALSFVEQGLRHRLQSDLRSAKISQAKSNKADALTENLNAQAARHRCQTQQINPVPHDHTSREWADGMDSPP